MQIVLVFIAWLIIDWGIYASFNKLINTEVKHKYIRTPKDISNFINNIKP